ncbi:MAG: 2,3-bisphosphoglycerate-independent phosphoglycerate mutase, partial [Rikenellaceae bacterium]
MNKVLLMILDGWGIGDKSKSDVIYTMHPSYMEGLMKKYPNSQLRTDGENVGLPDGQMGNSEVGHQNIGAGRIIYQDLVKINVAIRENKLKDNQQIIDAYDYAKANGKAVHFMGLVSDGGVHSSLEHLKALTDLIEAWGIDKSYIHCFMDGRDTDPRSGKGFIEQLQAHLEGGKKGAISDIIGRFYAMDRDKRWERVKEAYDLL